jgi:hypothetical protein
LFENTNRGQKCMYADKNVHFLPPLKCDIIYKFQSVKLETQSGFLSQRSHTL